MFQKKKLYAQAHLNNINLDNGIWMTFSLLATRSFKKPISSDETNKLKIYNSLDNIDDEWINFYRRNSFRLFPLSKLGLFPFKNCLPVNRHKDNKLYMHNTNIHCNFFLHKTLHTIVFLLTLLHFSSFGLNTEHVVYCE